jgi:alpha-D-xyloside xylohydrolase
VGALYEDDGTSYDYERGGHARTTITWDDDSHTLTIGERAGAYPGMLRERTIRVIAIRPGRAVPHSVNAMVDQTVRYAGAELRIRL